MHRIEESLISDITFDYYIIGIVPTIPDTHTFIISHQKIATETDMTNPYSMGIFGNTNASVYGKINVDLFFPSLPKSVPFNSIKF